MLRMNQFRSGESAKDYYTESLRQEGYHAKGASRAAHWHGKAAAMLGLSGEVEQKTFARLCDNLHPTLDQSITPRTRSDRTTGYDLNWHVPKSVSVVHAITCDERIAECVRAAVHDTMLEIESHAKTRVRVGGVEQNRDTGNLVWADFLHTTTRPMGGIPDPHLHVHCFVFNMTHDPVENRFKAGQFQDINRDAPYYQEAFYCRLARRLGEIGYASDRTAKGWELAGVTDAITRKFSRRTQEIEALAEQLGITDPDRKANLGSKTRDAKKAAKSPEAVQQDWHERLTPDEHARIDQVRKGAFTSKDRPVTDREAVDHAIGHRFERDSVVPLPRLLEAAIKRGLGSVTPEAVRAEVTRRPEVLLARIDEQTMTTTRAVLAEEKAMLAFARDGRNTCAALERGRGWVPPASCHLNSDQRAAVEHVLRSQDRVTLIRGGAGTGKTTLMREAVSAIESRGTPVVVVAPSADASRGVLRESGFPGAETLHRLLGDRELQAKAKRGVLWCDEAGLVGVPEMRKLFDLAESLGAQVVLSGDCKQHSPVQRGDALRLLESDGGLRPAEVLAVVRQQSQYRAAVEAMSRGRFDEGIAILDKLKAIREVADPERMVMMARDYVETIRSGRSCLAIAPTHAEGEQISSLIRAELKHHSKLSQEQTVVQQLRGLGWTEAQRRDAALYQPGHVVQFHGAAKGFRAGERARVIGRDSDDRVLVESFGVNGRVRRGREPEPRALPIEQAERFSVYEERQLPLAAGERIRISGNGKTKDGKHRLNNGAIYRLEGFTKDGDLRLDNGWVVDRGFGHLSHGYTTTSHAAQGKSVDRVLVSQSWAAIGAASAAQVYVSVSRGKQDVRIYTDDRAALVAAVGKLGIRRSASEVEAALSTNISRTNAERLKAHMERLMRRRAVEQVINRPRPARECGRQPGRGYGYGR
jgi:conjugative relaxase-like TrwC/TraI family protein